MLRILVVCLAMMAAVLGQRIVPLPSLKDQARIEQSFTNERIREVIPKLFEQYRVDAWLLAQREYGEDNVFWAIKSSVQFAARRRTIVLFARDPATSAIRRHDLVDNTDKIWTDINALLETYDPQRIALNIDSDFAFSDGLRSGERELLEKRIATKYKSRFVREPYLALDFIATRVDSMIPYFKSIMETVWAVIDLGFSSATITPGVTTTEDVVWWFREKIQELGYTTWFQTSVGVFREGNRGQLSGVIRRGDMLWCDIGFTAFNLHTDTQHVGYVLRENETEVPAGLREGLRKANIMQDILMSEIRLGRTGNEILASSRQLMTSRGINGTFYSHPVGDNGHAAGALIGYVNIQDPVPVRGDVPVIPNTWYSIELQATHSVPEWGFVEIEFRQEEDMYIDGAGTNNWVYGRQTEFHLVK